MIACRRFPEKKQLQKALIMKEEQKRSGGISVQRNGLFSPEVVPVIIRTAPVHKHKGDDCSQHLCHIYAKEMQNMVFLLFITL